MFTGNQSARGAATLALLPLLAGGCGGGATADGVVVLKPSRLDAPAAISEHS